MKATKPEDERYFKDIVLNSILKEISSEHGKTLQSTSSKPKKRINKRIVWLFLVAAFITGSTAFLIQKSNSIAAIPKAPTVLPEQTVIQTPKPQPKKIKVVHQQQSSELTVQKKENTLIMASQPAKASTKPTQPSEREIAKAQLLQQMKAIFQLVHY